MTTLCKHGTEIGRLHLLSRDKAYFANGDILVNDGLGWVVWGRVKPGNDPYATYQRAVSYQEKVRKERPAFAAYVQAVKASICLGKRWKFLAAINLMPDDPDGVWSEACDGYGDNVDLSIDEVADLCKLRAACMEEINRLGKVAEDK